MMWPEELRKKFWAYRYGGTPRKFPRLMDDASEVFGARGQCQPPAEIDLGVREIERKGPLERLLWVELLPNGSISIEPYCISGKPVEPRVATDPWREPVRHSLDLHKGEKGARRK
jgi:hypothetical protein